MNSLMVSTALMIGCGGDGSPEVRVVNATPTEIDPSVDDKNDLRIRISYRDGDGNLGGGCAEIHDCRGEALVTNHTIPPIASEEAVRERVAIEGELTLVVADVGEAPAAALPSVCHEINATGSESGALPFCVVLFDSAGARSEGACTEPIRITSPNAESTALFF